MVIFYVLVEIDKQFYKMKEDLHDEDTLEQRQRARVNLAHTRKLYNSKTTSAERMRKLQRSSSVVNELEI